MGCNTVQFTINPPMLRRNSSGLLLMYMQYNPDDYTLHASVIVNNGKLSKDLHQSTSKSLEYSE
jgi:hypothetical protein